MIGQKLTKTNTKMKETTKNLVLNIIFSWHKSVHTVWARLSLLKPLWQCHTNYYT